MIKILGLFGLLVFLTNCDQKRSKGVAESPFVRSGKAVAQGDRQYSDVNPRINADGDRVVFLSGRAPHEGSFRAYRLSVSSNSSPQRLTNNDNFEEIGVEISPDGLYTAVSYLDQSNHAIIRVQSFDRIDQSFEIAGNFTGVSNMAFSYETPPALSFISLNDQGERALQVVTFKAFKEGASNLELEASKVVSDFSAEEHSPIWTTTSDFTGLVTLGNTKQQGWLVKRSWTRAAGLGAAQKLGSLDRVLENALDAGALGVGLVNTTGVAADYVVPEGDKDDVGKVYFKNRARFTDLKLSPLESVDSKHFSVRDLGVTKVGRLAMILGYEVFACKSAGQYHDYFGSTVVLKTDRGVRKFAIRDDQGALTIVSQDYCLEFTETRELNDQPMDLQIDQMRLAANYKENKVNLVYQSWHRGDYEVFHLRFDFDGESIKNPVFTNLSSNTRPIGLAEPASVLLVPR